MCTSWTVLTILLGLSSQTRHSQFWSSFLLLLLTFNVSLSSSFCTVSANWIDLFFPLIMIKVAECWLCSSLIPQLRQLPHCCLLFHRSVISDSLQPHWLQHTRLPCSSMSPRICSDSCSLSRWCHPAISSSVSPFFSCPHSFPASGIYQWFYSSHRVAKVLEL